MNLWAQTFTREGIPISSPHQVNDPDWFPYSFQISGWRGVSANNDRILFTWLENRNHRGWDVIAKVTDWDEFPAVDEEPAVHTSPVTLTPLLNRLSYEVPAEAQLSIYNSAGRRVTEETIHGKGEWMPVDLSSGVYFARVESVQGSVGV